MTRFFKFKSNIKLSDIIPQVQDDVLIKGIDTIKQATPNHLTFFHNVKYKELLKTSKAYACFIQKHHVYLLPDHIKPIFTISPYRSMANVLNNFYEEISYTNIPPKIGNNCTISPHAIIENGVEIGDNTIIKPFCYIGKGVVIGNDARIDEGVSITHAIIKDQVVIKAGARIGQPGFGFETDENGVIDVLQIGCVYIGQNVQIGANTTIDRGSLDDTVIGDFCRIDNQVQIAHNVKIGKCCIIVSQVGIAGSTSIGDFCQIGGQAGIAGHLKIGNHVKLAAKSGVMIDIKDHEIHAGQPSMPAQLFFKRMAILNKLCEKKVC